MAKSRKGIRTNPLGKTFDSNPNATKEEVLAELERNKGQVVLTCRNTGISTNTFYNWKRDDKEFAAKVNELRDREGEQIYGKLIEAALAGNMTAIIFYCKTQLKMSEKQIVEMQSSGVDLNLALKSIKDELINE